MGIFTFFRLYKWNQIAQRTKDISVTYGKSFLALFWRLEIRSRLFYGFDKISVNLIC